MRSFKRGLWLAFGMLSILSAPAAFSQHGSDGARARFRGITHAARIAQTLDIPGDLAIDLMAPPAETKEIVYKRTSSSPGIERTVNVREQAALEVLSRIDKVKWDQIILELDTELARLDREAPRPQYLIDILSLIKSNAVEILPLVKGNLVTNAEASYKHNRMRQILREYGERYLRTERVLPPLRTSLIQKGEE